MLEKLFQAEKDIQKQIVPPRRERNCSRQKMFQVLLSVCAGWLVWLDLKANVNLDRPFAVAFKDRADARDERPMVFPGGPVGQMKHIL